MLSLAQITVITACRSSETLPTEGVIVSAVDIPNIESKKFMIVFKAEC